MPKRKSLLASSASAVDPTLDALFAASAGPVKAPPKSRYSGDLEQKTPNGQKAAPSHSDVDDEVLSEISEELDDEDDDEDDDDEDDGEDLSSEDEGHDSIDDGVSEPSLDEGADTGEAGPSRVEEETAEIAPIKRERKRKRKDKYEELEVDYLAKLSKDDDDGREGKRQKADKPGLARDGTDAMDDDDDEAPPMHETLAADAKPTDKATELEKAARTIFLSNVSTEAISSKSAKRTLLAHLSSAFDGNDAPPQKVESIRFRSVAFSAGSLPKRAAYITKALMAATTKSANAYAVCSSVAAARKAVAALNGTVVLGRHLRVDSVTHPTPTDHRRCVFVGNLHFVDDETVLGTDGDGETTEKKRTKVPADVEEGLWRTFSKQGKVENVRVVRDPKTRVGKGFAYVQFYDANSVESAILLDGKKFPPMLPRILRVTRAKDPRKTSLAQERAKTKERATNGPVRNTTYRPKVTPEEQSMAGRAGKLLGHSGAAQQRRSDRVAKGGPPQRSFTGVKTPEQIVFEGRRTSSKDGLPKDLKFGKKGKKAGKPKGRSARRGAEWRKKS